MRESEAVDKSYLREISKRVRENSIFTRIIKQKKKENSIPPPNTGGNEFLFFFPQGGCKTDGYAEIVQQQETKKNERKIINTRGRNDNTRETFDVDTKDRL